MDLILSVPEFIYLLFKRDLPAFPQVALHPYTEIRHIGQALGCTRKQTVKNIKNDYIVLSI